MGVLQTELGHLEEQPELLSQLSSAFCWVVFTSDSSFCLWNSDFGKNNNFQ